MCAFIFGNISQGYSALSKRSLRYGVWQSKRSAVFTFFSNSDILSTVSSLKNYVYDLICVFFTKLFASFWRNLLGIKTTMSGLETAESFKQHFISVSINAIKESIDNMEEGKLYFAPIDMSAYFKDKRDLIAKEDLPETASFCFIA